MIIVVRIDLDKYDLGELTNLIRDQVITIDEACTSHAFKTELNEYQQYLQIRAWKQIKWEEGHYAKSA